MRCPRCGQEVAPGTAVCPYCQNPLTAPAAPQAGEPAGYQPAYAPAAPNSTLAIVSLITGIAGLTLCPGIASIVAVITGFMARKEINEGGGRVGGGGMATGGLVTGFIGIGLGVIGLCIWIIMMIVAAGASSY